MEIIKTTFSDVTDLVYGILEDQREACVYCVGDEYCAIVGSNGGANIDTIRHLGVRLVQISHEGGTIIASPGDIQIGIFTEGYLGNEYRNNIINRIVDLIHEKGYDVQIDNNDVLVNGNKVIGFGSRMYGKILYSAIQISIECNRDLINTICTKPMRKQPDGLKNYKVTTQDIINILFSEISQ